MTTTQVDDRTGRVDAWLERIRDEADERGHYDLLGADHTAFFSDEGLDTLLVTFETATDLVADNGRTDPRAWRLTRRTDWSSLCVVAHGPSWFRNARIYGYFDRLVDDGFFEDFDRVIFYGAGACGYAAAAFSVVAPGATVVAISPQATLDPSIAGWDRRFTAQRRRCFTDRYGYAPDMIEGAERMFLIHDPDVAEDAMHAALFRAPNVTRLDCPHMGDGIEDALVNLHILPVILKAAAMGRLTPAGFHRAWRLRHRYLPYLRRLLVRLQAAGRHGRVIRLVNGIDENLLNPRFRRARALAETALNG